MPIYKTLVIIIYVILSNITQIFSCKQLRVKIWFICIFRFSFLFHFFKCFRLCWNELKSEISKRSENNFCSHDILFQLNFWDLRICGKVSLSKTLSCRSQTSCRSKWPNRFKVHFTYININASKKLTGYQSEILNRSKI